MDLNPACPKLPWMVDFHTTDDSEILNGQLKAAFASTTLEYLSALHLKSKTPDFRATQLVCTVPPYATCNTITELMAKGMSVARINIPDYNKEKILETISKVRAINESYSRKIGRVCPVAVALEIRGPEIRIGNLKDDKEKLYLPKGKITTITTDPSYEDFVDENMIYVDYQKLPNLVQSGDRLILGRGSVALSTIEAVESIIRCIVDRAGDIISRDAVIVPNAPVELPLISSEDKEIMDMCVQQNVDFLYVSGVFNKDSICEIKDALGISGEKIQIISKIENSISIEYIDEIIKSSDGICIDSERLMVELPKEKVFIIQKSILAKCMLAGVPSICSVNISGVTSLVKSEVCDIANAVIDGADCLQIPLDACTKEIMNDVCTVCKEAEPALYQKQIFNELVDAIGTPIEAIYSLCIAAVEASLKSNAAAIVVLTASGRTAKIISRFKPRCPIISITRYARVARILKIFRGVDPIVYLKPLITPYECDVDQRVQLGITYGKFIGYIRVGDAVVTVTGSRPESGMPNNLKIIYAADCNNLPRSRCDK